MSTRFSTRIFGVADFLRTVGWALVWIGALAAAIRVVTLVASGEWRAFPVILFAFSLLVVAWLLRRVGKFVAAHDRP